MWGPGKRALAALPLLKPWRSASERRTVHVMPDHDLISIIRRRGVLPPGSAQRCLMQFRMKSALIGAAVGVVLGFWVRMGDITRQVPTASTPVEAAVYWLSYFTWLALIGFVVGGFISKRPASEP
jgi:hypothetical protein